MGASQSDAKSLGPDSGMRGCRRGSSAAPFESCSISACPRVTSPGKPGSSVDTVRRVGLEEEFTHVDHRADLKLLRTGRAVVSLKSFETGTSSGASPRRSNLQLKSWRYADRA